MTSDPPQRPDAPEGTMWFRFGDGYLALRSGDPDFAARFLDLYDGCRSDGPEAGAVVVKCTIDRDDRRDQVSIHFEDPEPFDPVPFALLRLADFGYEESVSAEPGSRLLVSGLTSASLAFHGSTILADPESKWPSVAASLAVHRVLRLQRGLSFFHAGSVGIGGRGVLLFGAKGSGKTTLSLALADRGHHLFGDELAALRRDTLELIPFRRRLSIRPGPASAGVENALASRAFTSTQLEDGTCRTLAHVADLFPGPLPQPVRLHAIIFLHGMSAASAATSFAPAAADARLLAPFESATWGQPTGLIAFRLMQLLGRVRCYHLELGPIPETARLIETLVMEE